MKIWWCLKISFQTSISSFKIEIDGDNSTYTSDHPTEETGNTSTVTVLPTEEETDETTLDPCSNYSPLPNAYDRFYYNIINGSSGSVLHDRHLVEGWYRAGLSLDMPTVAPSHLYCGTNFPVWLNGEFKDTFERYILVSVPIIWNQEVTSCWWRIRQIKSLLSTYIV